MEAKAKTEEDLTTADQSVLPEIDVHPEVLTGGSEALDDNQSSAAFWSMFRPDEVSFFKMPLLDQLRHRPYHEATVAGPFDLRQLANDHRQHLYRSVVLYPSDAGASISRLLLWLGDGVFVVYEHDLVQVFAPTPQAAASVAIQFRRYRKPAAQDQAGFHLVSIESRGAHTEWVMVGTCRADTADELKLHYGEEFAAWELTWTERLHQRPAGVTVLFGPPGCGKTCYLRSLMSRFVRQFVFYYLPVSSFDVLSSPQFVAFWLEENRRHRGKIKLAILEDAEDLLLPRDESSRAKVSNLLNIGDGFLGEHLRLHVVATTNAPRQRLDAALLRPGRLMGTREFRRLSCAEARRLAEAKGLELPDQRDYSLAEIYNRAADRTALECQRRAGFA